jgi:hypothetical protein
VTRQVRAEISGEIYVQLPAPEAPKPVAPTVAKTHSSSHAAKPPAAAPPKGKVRGPVETDL